MAYSNDLRQRVLALYDEGKKTRQISQQLRVSPAWARRVKQRRNQPPRKIGGSKPRLDPIARAALLCWIESKPDLTLEELRQRIKEDMGFIVSVGCLWNTLRAMKLTFKKSR
jgi:transposase